MATSKLTTKQQVESIWELGGLTPLQLIKNVWKQIDEENVLGLAAELAYSYLLAIFPFLLFLLSVFGLFAARGTVLRTNLLFYFSPGGHIANFVEAKLHLGWVAVTAWKILQWPAALFFVILAFSLIYYYAPNVKQQHWYWITPGSVVGVLLWVAASFGFRVYLHFFNSYSSTYGSLGAVIILLVWFYVTGLAFLVGGEINAEIEHAAAERGHPEAKAEGEKISPADRQAA